MISIAFPQTKIPCQGWNECYDQIGKTFPDRVKINLISFITSIPIIV